MFGIGNLFDPLKMAGTNLFGGPQPAAAASGSTAWGNITPPGAKPPSLLQAGGEGPGGSNAMPLTRATDGPPPSVASSLDTSVPPTIESSQALHPAETAVGPTTLTGRVPESTTPMTGITSPSLSPQYAPTPPTALETGGAGGNIRSPYDAPAAAPAPAGGTAAPGGATPSTAATATQGGGAMGKLADVGKALAGAGGAQAGKAAGFAPGGVGAAFTPNGSALMAEVMKLHPPTAIGPVPGLPPGLLNRFKGG